MQQPVDYPSQTGVIRPSHRACIEALEIGESYCIARKLDQNEATSELIASTVQQVHNMARTAIARATASTGHTYTGEQGEWRTSRGHHPVVSFLVTRTK